jgi:hypothetical protein
LAAHQADVWRAQLLLEQGGFYFDWDLMLLRSPERLRGNVCVMGVERLESGYREVLGVSAIGAAPGSVFLQCWLNQMPAAATPEDYVAHSTVLACDMAAAFPAGVNVLPSRSFYWPGWTEDAMRWLFDPTERISDEALEAWCEGVIGVHLFDSHANFHHHAKHLTLDQLRNRDCNFSALAADLFD